MNIVINLKPTNMIIYFDRFSVDGARDAAFEYFRMVPFSALKPTIIKLKDELTKREELAKKVELAKKLPETIELSDGTNSDLSLFVDPALKNRSLDSIQEDVQKLKIYTEALELRYENAKYWEEREQEKQQ